MKPFNENSGTETETQRQTDFGHEGGKSCPTADRSQSLTSGQEVTLIIKEVMRNREL